MPNGFMCLEDRLIEKTVVWSVDLRYGFIPAEVDMTLRVNRSLYYLVGLLVFFFTL